MPTSTATTTDRASDGTYTTRGWFKLCPDVTDPDIHEEWDAIYPFSCEYLRFPKWASQFGASLRDYCKTGMIDIDYTYEMHPAIDEKLQTISPNYE